MREPTEAGTIVYASCPGNSKEHPHRLVSIGPAECQDLRWQHCAPFMVRHLFGDEATQPRGSYRAYIEWDRLADPHSVTADEERKMFAHLLKPNPQYRPEVGDEVL